VPLCPLYFDHSLADPLQQCVTVADDHESNPVLLRKGQDSLPDQGLSIGIQHRRHFIRNQIARSRVKDASDRNTLQFAAAEFVGIALEASGLDAQGFGDFPLGSGAFVEALVDAPARVYGEFRVLKDCLTTFLFVGSHLCRWLPSDPFSRRRPCLRLVVVHLSAPINTSIWMAGSPTGDFHPISSRPCWAYTIRLHADRIKLLIKSSSFLAAGEAER
jgi:hypothetical protein